MERATQEIEPDFRFDYTPSENIPAIPISWHLFGWQRIRSSLVRAEQSFLWRCRCCAQQTLPDYMVRDLIWTQVAGIHENAGLVCIPCLDERLLARRGSSLTFSDFTKALINRLASPKGPAPAEAYRTEEAEEASIVRPGHVYVRPNSPKQPQPAKGIC